MTTAQIQLPPKLIPVFRGKARYRCAYGGRGSAKTRTFALMTAVVGYQRGMNGDSGQILCGREHLNSLEDSSMEEIKTAIRSVPWLDAYYEIGEKYIRSKDKRINYVFAGLRHNLDSIKSKARLLLAWIDEAENVSEQAWRKLGPTVREAGSEVWVTWNPESKESATHKRFRVSPPESCLIAEINYSDNPWFPEVLELERLEDLKNRPDTYSHIWEGDFLEHSNAQILSGKWRVAEFDPKPEWQGPYYGLDFGFAQDPTAAVCCWINDRKLYIEREAGKVGLELDATAQYVIQRLPNADTHTVRADSARPESISYLKRNGLPRIEGVKKWPGSVEDGIEHLRSYDEIVIHSRCTSVRREAQLYSYKVDKNSGDVLPVVLDDHNHYIDAIRYALAPMIKRGSQPMTLGMKTVY